MQQLGLFDAQMRQEGLKNFEELRAEYKQKLALAGAEPYVHVYTQLLWCVGQVFKPDWWARA
jgi:hypothetical protein